MSKEIQTMTSITIQTVYLSLQELTNSNWKRKKQHKSKLVLLNVGGTCMAGIDFRATGRVSPEFIPSASTSFLRTYSLDGYIAQPRYSRQVLGPSLVQCALPPEEWIREQGRKVCGCSGKRGGVESGIGM